MSVSVAQVPGVVTEVSAQTAGGRHLGKLAVLLHVI